MRLTIIIISFLQTFLLIQTSLANGETCLSNTVLNQTRKQICEAECEAFYKENPEARPNNRDGVCETSIERLRAHFSPSRKLNQALACGNGLWNGILSLPDQLRAYIKFAHEASSAISENIKERNQKIRDCEASLDCKINLARGLMRFETQPINETELVKFATNTHAFHIMQSLEREYRVKRENCFNILSDIRREVMYQAQKHMEVYGPKHEALVYARLEEQNADCPSRLNLENPNNPKPKADTQVSGTSWLESLGIKLQCYNSAQVAELICLEIASFVVDPLNLVIGGGLYLKAIKTAGIRGAEKNALELPKNNQFPVRRRPENFTNRNQFVKAYLNREFTTEAQNRAWIATARSTQPDGKHVFVDIENSKLKFLNDTFNDKDLVTALTNRHKEIVLQNMDELRRKYPNLEILEYSDFKSLRFAIKQPVPANLEDELNQVLLKSNETFAKEMTSKGILRASDDIQNWFRGGIGETADQANTAARFSRKQAELKLEKFNTRELKAYFNTELSRAETLRSQLSQKPFASTLFESVNQGAHLIPKREIFEATRKLGNAADLQKDIQVRFGETLTLEDAQNLIEYVKIVDSFTPGIHVAKREIVSVTNAAQGAVTMDFTGMGAYNLRETALALTRSSNLETALEQTRLAERRVTQMFERRMKEKINVIDNFLGQKKNMQGLQVRCSGDDCIGIFTSRITPKDQRDLVQRLSKSDFPSGVRISFIPDGVKLPEMRNQLANHGEALEKMTRKELAGKVPESVLNNITLGISMKGQEVGTGTVQLLIGNSRQPLSKDQLAEIHKAFTNATKSFNEKATKTSRRTINYIAVPDSP